MPLDSGTAKNTAPVMKISLRYKATLLIAITESVLLGLLLVSNLYHTRADLEQQLSMHADSTAELIAASTTEALLADDSAQLHNQIAGAVNRHRIAYGAIVDHQGDVLAEAGVEVNDGSRVATTQSIQVAGTRLGAVKLQVSRAETEAQLARTTKFNLMIVGFEMLLVALISLSLGWFLTRSLVGLSRGAEAIGGGDYGARVPVSSEDEVSDVARHFNAMAEKLEHTVNELARNRKRFQDLADNTSDWLWEMDLEGRYTYVSKKVDTLLGNTPSEIVGASACDLMLPEDAERLKILFNQAKRERRAFYGYEYRAARDDGTEILLEANGIPVFDECDRLIGYRGVTRDVSRRKDDEARLVYLAEHDPLTGLISRNKFLSLLDDEIRLAAYSQLPLALLFVDLDGFKLLNDTHGHVVGDTVLRVIANILNGEVGEGNLLARLGGDEFGVVLRAADAGELAQRLSSAIASAQLSLLGHSVHVSAGIGIATFPDCGRDGETLLARADIAMSRAKSSGHNRYHLYQASDKDIDSMQQTVNWRTRIHGALEARRLRLEFQPIVSVGGGRAAYYEALVRLEDETGNVHNATQFINTAELTGQVASIDRWTLENVLHALRDPRYRGSVIAMNLSGRSLGTDGFLEHFQQRILHSRIDPAQLMFEITESAAVAELAKAESCIATMKKLGYRFSLDDFGVGLSSFSYLKHFPVDQIKIDGSFIRHFDRSREDQIFVRAILQLARELGLETVAEFVQSAATLDLLIDMGIDYVQGHYIARPAATLATVDLQRLRGKTGVRSVARTR